MNNTETWKNEQTEQLFEAILSLQTVKECENFFRDLLTLQEIEVFASRFEAAKLLEQGKKSYREISKETGLSTTTITRINNWLNYGCNGYKTAISNLNHHHKDKDLVAL